MKPSKYKEEIYKTTVTTKANILIDATAGSGKSTTLTEIAKLLPYGKTALFCAFNKSIVKELEEKLPNTVQCKTMHSMGCKSIRDYYKFIRIKENKQIRFIMPYFEDLKGKEKWAAIYQVDALMQKIRVTMTPLKKEEIDKLIEQYVIDIDTKNIPITIKALKDFYKYNDEEQGNIEIDFTDMIEMPVRNSKIKPPQFDYLFIDECQDMSNLDQLFLNKLVKVNGRKFIAGDKNQSIYNFRGSSPKSFDNFANSLNTIKLPLSISYRCGKKIVEEAKKIYGVIEPFEDNEDGIVRRNGKIEEIQEGDMVLCRNSRPLIEVFFQLIDMGKKAYIVGSDMEKGLLNLLVHFDSKERTENCIERLELPLKTAKSALHDKGITNPLVHPRYLAMEEKILILKCLFNKFITVGEVENFIESIFEDEEREGVALLTIHKAKGMENDRVFLIESYEGKKLIPSPYATTEEMKVQEQNLLFVGITRAKKELVYLNL